MLTHDLLSRGDDYHDVAPLSLHQVMQEWVGLAIVLEDVRSLGYFFIDL